MIMTKDNIDTLMRRRDSLAKELANIEKRLKIAIEIERSRLADIQRPMLTDREKQILTMLRQYPKPLNKIMAAELNLSERTVKFHISALIRKFGVTSRQDL